MIVKVGGCLLAMAFTISCARGTSNNRVQIATVAASPPAIIQGTSTAASASPFATRTPPTTAASALTPLPQIISVTFEMRYPAGTFDGPPREFIPYGFKVAGYPLGSLSHHRALGELTPVPPEQPFFAEKGDILLVYLPPSTPPGSYTLTIRTPEGAFASATFLHTN
jgi:hypothetical protein